MIPQIIDRYQLLVRGVTDPRDHEGIRAALAGHPILARLFGVDESPLVLHPKNFRYRVEVPVDRLRLTEVEVNQVTFEEEVAVTVRLPEKAIRTVAAWDAAEKGKPGYRYLAFLQSLQGDLDDEVGRELRRVLAAKIDGIQGQAHTGDPRVQYGEVGVSKRTAKVLRRLFGLKSANGLWVLLQRYPVAGPNGARWVKLRILSGVDDHLLFVNGLAWQIEHQGDADGDTAYIGCQAARVAEKRDPGAFPRLTLREGSDLPLLPELRALWKPASPEDDLVTVMGRCLKELTGPLVHTYQCLARAAAVQSAFPMAGAVGYSEALTEEQRFRRMLNAYRGTYRLLCAKQERVMDFWKRKDEQLAADAADRLADALQAAVHGEEIDAAAFGLFLSADPKERLLLAKVLEYTENNLHNVRKTAFGRLLSTGRNWQVRHRLVDAMLKLGKAPAEILPALEAEVLGEGITRLKVTKPGAGEAPILPGMGEDGESLTPQEEQEYLDEALASGLARAPGALPTLEALLASVQYQGKPILSLVKLVLNKQGQPPQDGLVRAQVRLTLPWRPREVQGRAAVPSEVFELTLPDVWDPVAFLKPRTGHVKLSLGRGKERLFRPILYRTPAGTIGTREAPEWLADALAEGVRRCGTLQGKITGVRMEEQVMEAVRQALHRLTVSSPQEDLIRRYEYQVEFPATESVREGWAVKRALLAELVALGYNVQATSKNKPGTIVTQNGKYGLPNYHVAVSPLARYLDPKRACEFREIRQALPLWDPQPLTVTLPGWKLPQELARCLTQLVVMGADLPGVNMYPLPDGSWTHHDTWTAFPSITDKIALAGMKWEAETIQAKNELEARLLFDLGLDPTQVTVTNEPVPMGSVMKHRWVVTYRGRWDEMGKLKAAAGGGKGVVTRLPMQPLYDAPDGTVVPIDLCISRQSLLDKKQLELVLIMLLAKAKIETVDMAWDLDTLVAVVQAKLIAMDRDPDGLEEVYVMEGDTKVVLGRCLVGPGPFYRPPQTASNQFRRRHGANGIKVHSHAMVMGVREEAGQIVDRVRFTTSAEAYEDFARRLTVRRALTGIISGVEKNGWPVDESRPAAGEAESGSGEGAGEYDGPEYTDQEAPAF